MIYLFKSSKRRYLCESCVDAPKDFINTYDDVEGKEANTEAINEISLSIKSIEDQIVKVDFAEVSSDLLNKIVEIKTLDAKFDSLETKIEKIIEDKITSLQVHNKADSGLTELSDTFNFDNIINPIVNKFEPFTKLLESKENEHPWPVYLYQ